MRIGMLDLATSTGPTGSPELRLTVPVSIDGDAFEEVRDGSATLAHPEVQLLREACDEFLAGRRL